MTLVAALTSFTVLMLLASVVLSWVADLRRTGGAISARETHVAAEHAGRSSFYTSREERAEAMRERIRRERTRRERARAGAATGSASASGSRPAPPPGPDRPPEPPVDLPEARHRRTLELPAGEVTMDTVRFAYRRLVVAYHPDRVAGLGAKLQRLAEEETKAINEAYAFFKARL